jgi:hypothetical protein
MPRSLLSFDDLLNFNFDIHARRQVQSHQHINRFGIWVEYVDQPIVCADLEVLMRVFIYECRTAYCKPFSACWQGYRTHNMRAATFSRFNNSLGRLIQHTMIIRLEADTDFLFRHPITYSMILVTTPAPTVRPPSRMANFEPCSNATGTINSTVRFTLSPGITISTPSGREMLPVTSIVRM